jgi:hypothetical protein
MEINSILNDIARDVANDIVDAVVDNDKLNEFAAKLAGTAMKAIQDLDFEDPKYVEYRQKLLDLCIAISVRVMSEVLKNNGEVHG